jgi:hypothetical protein
MAISIEKYATMPARSEADIEEKSRCWFEKCILLISCLAGTAGDAPATRLRRVPFASFTRKTSTNFPV